MKKRQITFSTPQMRTLHLIRNDGLYTNLALLLSDQCPYVTKVATFQGSDKAFFRDRKEFTGSLLKQLEDCYSYLDKANMTSASFSGLIRNDKKIILKKHSEKHSLMQSVIAITRRVSVTSSISIMIALNLYPLEDFYQVIHWTLFS